MMMKDQLKSFPEAMVPRNALGFVPLGCNWLLEITGDFPLVMAVVFGNQSRDIFFYSYIIP